MDKNFAVIYENKVINVILAKDLKTAEKVTDLECIECDGSFWIDWIRVDGIWVKPIETPVVVDEG